ncbi:cobalamin B12-binding domain-containing protein [Micromonospora tulbaghiae]|uniref:Methylaspartate mutase sigma subunit n=1 Tax=Micromonospora tulbaghiae TaxID=479978 RepID=A0ABY0KHR8_9ACTN|nr:MULTISPECIES: cobalamin-dependent protein [Micromonospora]MDX5458373.1 cobalamin-dependent protein [Micromonospora tulbaghiae]SCE74436.1 methylaspartate mutase sigma subunit [Micromonospora tulbaghiae]
MTLSPVVERPPARGGRTVVLGTVSSDAHTWNLVYLQLLLEEAGHRVINLGACVPAELFATACRTHRPDLAVVSSVNGHGCTDGKRLAAVLRADPELAGLPLVIGGKLGVDGKLGPAQVAELFAAGYTAVFHDGADRDRFLEYLGRAELTTTGRPG